MSTAFNIPAIDLSRYKIEEKCVNIIPEKMARQYRLIAISKLSNTLIVAMADPLNIVAIDDLKMLTNFDIEPVLGTETEIVEAIDKFYATEGAGWSDIIKEKEEEGELEVVTAPKEEFDLSEAALEGENPPIVKIVNLIS